jgi:hypothetical protein
LDTKFSRLGQFGGRPIKKGAIFPGPINHSSQTYSGGTAILV